MQPSFFCRGKKQNFQLISGKPTCGMLGIFADELGYTNNKIVLAVACSHA
jgi:hypothetical protein